jgi:hypothetical protein
MTQNGYAEHVPRRRPLGFKSDDRATAVFRRGCGSRLGTCEAGRAYACPAGGWPAADDPGPAAAQQPGRPVVMAVDLPIGADLHRYERPGWLCIECGDPWPCQRARAAIVAEYGPGRPVAALTYLRTRREITRWFDLG